MSGSDAKEELEFYDVSSVAWEHAGAPGLWQRVRGLHGLSALASVSERVAHRAHCSVLVVRPVPATHHGSRVREE